MESGKNPTRADKHRAKDEEGSNHMIVSVMERFGLLQLLPTKVDFASMRVVNDLQQALSLSEDDLKQIKFRQEGTNLMWGGDAAAKIKKTVVIGERAKSIITEQIKNVEELDIKHYDLYARFVDFPDEEAHEAS